MMTRMLPMKPAPLNRGWFIRQRTRRVTHPESRSPPATVALALQLRDRGVAPQGGLDPVPLPEVHLGLAVVTTALNRKHPAQAVTVVIDQVTSFQRRNGPVAWRVNACPPGKPFGGR